MTVVRGIDAVPAGRVAIVSHSHPTVTNGGGELAAYALFLGLRARGHDPIFIAACPREAGAWIELGRDEFAILYDEDGYEHFYNLGVDSVGEELMAVLERERVGLVNFHHYMNLGIDTIRDVATRFSTVLTLHEFLAICRHNGQMVTRPERLLCEQATPRACATCFPEHSRQQFALRRQVALEAFAQVEAFVSPSAFLAGRYIDWGLPATRMHVVENGLIDAPVRQARLPRDANAAWTVGFFGQITPFKGMRTILEACEIVARDLELAARLRLRVHGNFVGVGAPFIAEFEEAARTYPFLQYVGAYDNRRVGALMRACDYVLVPSEWWENSPVVIQEAFAAGRPVICTGIGGMAEKVHDDVSGLHFERGDAADLVRAIRKGMSEAVHMRLAAGLPETIGALGMADHYGAVFASVARDFVVESESPA